MTSVHVSCVLSTDVDEQAALLGNWTQCYQQLRGCEKIPETGQYANKFPCKTISYDTIDARFSIFSQPLSPGRFIGSLCQAQFGRTQLFREITSQRVHEVGTACPESLVFAVARSAASEPVRWRGKTVVASDVAFFPGDEEFDIVLSAGCELHAVAIDLAEFSRYAQDLSADDVPRHFTLPAQVLSSPEHQSRFAHFLEASLQAVIDTPHALHLPQAQEALREDIYARIFDLLDAREATVTLSPTKRFALVAEVRRYANERTDAVPSVAGICRVFGVSRRSLQYAFAEVAGVNPVSYLRALRLNAVRHAIKEAGEDTPVLEIAARWGFWHPSHFSASYKHLFGESPSKTRGRHIIRAAAD